MAVSESWTTTSDFTDTAIENSSSTNASLYNHDLVTIHVTTFVVTGVAGLLTNGFALLVLLGSHKMRSNMRNHLIINQTLIDFCTCFFMVINIPTGYYIPASFSGVAQTVYCYL